VSGAVRGLLSPSPSLDCSCLCGGCRAAEDALIEEKRARELAHAAMVAAQLKAMDNWVRWLYHHRCVRVQWHTCGWRCVRGQGAADEARGKKHTEARIMKERDEEAAKEADKRQRLAGIRASLEEKKVPRVVTPCVYVRVESLTPHARP
jgi:hypothetical protein